MPNIGPIATEAVPLPGPLRGEKLKNERYSPKSANCAFGGAPVSIVPWFYSFAEVDELVPLCDSTRWRLERKGRFPRRIRISSRKSVYRKSDIDAWQADPEGWRAPSAEAAA
ncbi:helix-turn-helix transcriptional regulator [Bradyrhizobium sp. TM233]|uniref:helix-turn-helix transcriptional regulator n=1 Tax=Bradyrhizobium sp. TM233 TaxID=2599801 RepID=UPI00403D659D